MGMLVGGFYSQGGGGSSYTYNLDGDPFGGASDPIGTPPGTFDVRGGIEVRYNGTIYAYSYTIGGGEIMTPLDSGTDWAIPNHLSDHKPFDFRLDVTSGTPTSGISDSTGVWLNVDTGGTVTGSGLRWVLKITSGSASYNWTLRMRDGSDTELDTGIYGGFLSAGF